MEKPNYEKCRLCARYCLVNRTSGERGFCRMGDKPAVARISLHEWEEPIISGERGSGTVFFVGCSLGCVYCQNKAISRGMGGREMTVGELATAMLSLQNEGAHNINLVTPTHFIPSIIKAVKEARDRGLSVPIVYNTGSYDAPDSIRSLEGTVDVYLPDLKYYRKSTAGKLSLAENYPRVAREAIAEMVRQQSKPLVENGLIKKGVVVRLLLLPGHLAECKLNLKYLYDTYGDSIYISLMSQYTPVGDMKAPLNRRVSNEEYRELVDYALRLGVKNAFTQEGASASESFIPDFFGENK